MTHRQARRIFALLLVLLLAAVLRIVHLTQQSLWTDEGFTYNVIVRADMFPEIVADTHPPLYYVLLRGWVSVAGDSVLALRFFSVILSMLSVAMMAPLARALTKGRALVGASVVPTLAALGLALADSENFLAQEIRMYTLTTLLVIFSVYAYARWYHHPRTKWAVLWLMGTVALAHTYYLGLYIPFVQGLHALLFLRGQTRVAAVGMLAAAGLLSLPWLLGVTLNQIATPPPHEMFNSQPSDLATLVEIRDKYLTEQWTLMGALALLGMVTVTYKGRIRARLRPLREPVLVAMWAILPVIMTFIANAWLPILTPRKLALIAPALALLVAWGLGNLRKTGRGILTAVIVVYGVTTVDFYQLKEPWNEVSEDMTRYALPGDLALMEVGLGGYPLDYYLDHSETFSTSDADAIPAFNLPRWRTDEPLTYESDLNGLLAEHSTVWLAHWSPETHILELLADAGLVQTAVQTTDHLGNDVNVYRYDRLPETAVTTYDSRMTLLDAQFEQVSGRLDLWWRADAPLNRDYSVSAFVLDESGALVAQSDAFPFENQRATTTWQPGEVIYDPHPLAIAALPPGRYSLGVKVYTYVDNAVYTTADGEQYAVIGEFIVP